MYPSRILSSAPTPTERWSSIPAPRRSTPRSNLTLVRESVPDYGSAIAASDPAGQRADELLVLGDRIADLARSIQVAEAEMMG
ncbi:MAG: hypothetical protein KJO11_12505, partial [Gemmatimonadetes bacterium]|nr:hypothetical protein [Gemmatimonadota bacterium]